MTTTKSLFVAALLSAFAAASFAQAPTPSAAPQHEQDARHHQMHKHHSHRHHHRHHAHRAHKAHDAR